MSTLSEDRIQRFLDHAQMSLFFHEHGQQARDPRYREVLEFVDEIVDLLGELRRERTALERIAAMGEGCLAADPATRQRLAVQMCLVAREALELPMEPPLALVREEMAAESAARRVMAPPAAH